MSNFPLSFTSAIIPPPGRSLLWGATERYLNVTDERYQVSQCEGRRYVLSLQENFHQNWWVKALKVVSFCLIIFPLIALVCRSIYRSQKQFVSSAPIGHPPITTPSVVLTPSLPLSASVSSNTTVMAPTQMIPSQSSKTGPIKGFEEGNTTVLCDGQPSAIVIRSARATYGKVFRAYVINGNEREEIAVMQFQRFRISKKTGDYKSENYPYVSWPLSRYGREERVPRIYVDMIKSPKNEKYKGVGTALMQAAMEYGYAKGCSGRIDLEACWSSHVFYYKLGMRSYSKKTNQKIKAYSESGGRPDTSELEAIAMFMPKEAISEWQVRIRRSPIFQTTRDNLAKSAAT